MSERVLMQDCGDAIRRADNGCWGKGPVAKTGNFTIKLAQSGTMYTNLGAIGAVVFTLPTPKPGVWFTFVKAVPAQAVTLRAPTGITIGAGAAGAAYTNVTSEMGGVTVIGISKTGYAVMAQYGTWAPAALLDEESADSPEVAAASHKKAKPVADEPEPEPEPHGKKKHS